jgi:hypothetical protein
VGKSHSKPRVVFEAYFSSIDSSIVPKTTTTTRREQSSQPPSGGFFFGATPMTDIAALKAANAHRRALAKTTRNFAGTNFSASDGSTTVNLPDVRGRVLAG